VNHLQITNMLEGLSQADLRQLQTAISDKLLASHLVLRAGMKCIVDHKKVRNMIGEIVKINRTRCKVEFKGKYMETKTFNVPMSMIQSA